MCRGRNMTSLRKSATFRVKNMTMALKKLESLQYQERFLLNCALKWRRARFVLVRKHNLQIWQYYPLKKCRHLAKTSYFTKNNFVFKAFTTHTGLLEGTLTTVQASRANQTCNAIILRDENTFAAYGT